MKKTARHTALTALLRVTGKGGYSNLVLDSLLRQNGLDRQDSAFAGVLFYGTLERLLTLDYVIAQHASRPMSALSREVQGILRLGVYQLLYLDGVPDSAAVNESVNLAKAFRQGAGAAGFVNAVLRSVIRDGSRVRLPEREKDPAYYLQIKYSAPQWLVKLLADSYGEAACERFLARSIGRPPVTARVNTLRTDAAGLADALAREGVRCLETPVADAVLLENTGGVEALEAYQAGLFHVQDTACQLCCEALDPQPGETVLDLCSAPGGKAFTLAERMRGQGRVIACDLHEKRVNLIRQAAARLGLPNIEAFANDASKHNPDMPQADRILCDVPCSGLGIIRRKPEIKYKEAADFAPLPAVQYRILETAAHYLKPGGLLVYSTCTVNPAENEQVVDRFLQGHAAFEAQPLSGLLAAGGQGGRITLLGDIADSDGFFIAALKRTR